MLTNARGQGGRTDVPVEALCEDGDFLASHRPLNCEITRWERPLPDRAKELQAKGMSAPETGRALGVSIRTVFRPERSNETTRTTSPGSLVYKPNNLTGHQASIDLILVSAPPALMGIFTASSIGSLKGTSIRSRPCS